MHRFPARVALLLAVALGASGCFLNEIDKSVATLPGQGKAAAAAKSETAVAKATPKDPKQPSWWETATTLGSEESTADIVGCKLAGGVEFMTRDDCLARGGATE